MFIVRDGDVEHGPVSLARVQAMHDKGEIGTDAQFRAEDSGHWMSVGKEFGKPPAPAPAGAKPAAERESTTNTMTGTVKWFSQEKGYGFLVGSDGQDRYFAVQEIRGAVLPGNGTPVKFRPAAGKRGPRARGVELLAAPASNGRTDDRATCGNCGKRMIPRVVTGPPAFSGHRWTPEPKYSMCPFCAAKHETFEKEADGTLILIIVVVFAALILFAMF